ncbi:AI-2E family transporter [Actinomycetospora endophytica]|uniref:AI-2E family transporter n=1 Tax=Actinomycetospora endophytica TaxID=2291215 RepID=A0ABS8P8Y4_9PSEU|nr:AI-2E family transporter [Actinomycetospora endophytica]MCD2194747.1 AI-2E family transporter [Actinomycetospora endophytica]
MTVGEAALVTATVLGVGVLAAAAWTARGALVLVFVGFFLATGIEPAVRYLGRHRVRRGLAVVLVVLAVLVVITAVVAIIVVPAAHQVGVLAQEIPDLMNRLGDRLGGSGSSLGAALQDPAQHQQVQEQASGLGKAVAGAVGAVFAVLGTVLGGVFAAVTVLALMVYFALAMPRIRAGLDRALVREDRTRAADAALGRIGGYVSGQLLVSLIAGLASLVFFLIAGLPYPALLALVVAILDAVPQIGATLASLAGIGVALSVSVGLAIATLIFFCVYQAFENYLIAPRVFARTVELSPAAAFVALLVGAALGGLLGAITALPLTAAGKVVIRQVLDERRAARGVKHRPPDHDTARETATLGEPA